MTDANTGAFTYTPNAGARGEDSFSFKANDDTTDSNVATVTITIGNAAPVAVSETIYINKGSGVFKGRVRASDADGDALKYTTIADGKHGVVILNPTTGEFSYTKNSSFQDNDSFQFKVSDGKVDSKSATVTLVARDPTIYLPLMTR
jgi:hypothetical protein